MPLDCSGNLNPERAATADTVTPTVAAASAGSTPGMHESTLCQHPAQYVMQNQRVSVDQDFNPPTTEHTSVEISWLPYQSWPCPSHSSSQGDQLCNEQSTGLWGAGKQNNRDYLCNFQVEMSS